MTVETGTISHAHANDRFSRPNSTILKINHRKTGPTITSFKFSVELSGTMHRTQKSGIGEEKLRKINRVLTGVTRHFITAVCITAGNVTTPSTTTSVSDAPPAKVSQLGLSTQLAL